MMIRSLISAISILFSLRGRDFVFALRILDKWGVRFRFVDIRRIFVFSIDDGNFNFTSVLGLFMAKLWPTKITNQVIHMTENVTVYYTSEYMVIVQYRYKRGVTQDVGVSIYKYIYIYIYLT